MCGIAGVVALEPAAESLLLTERARAMADVLRHRGPDDCGLWRDASGRVALSHRRLAIVDLSSMGRNPMSWDGGRLQITFNGEIYNFRELRRELEADGHRFRSQTDTEVILASYDQWGLECVHHLFGMFAFGLWDETRRRLWLVRDRVGKKPLYYSEAGGCLSFASELKSLTADAATPRQIDFDAVRLYLRYGYIPSPLTIHKHVRKLPPGHQLLCEDGRISVSRYWDPVAVTQDARRTSDAESALETVLSTAVRQRMIADVPVGAFLSGGIDSSLVVALMREQSRDPVRTFTIRFEQPEFNEADDAAAVAHHLGTEHHEQTCSNAQMLDVVGRLVTMFDEPFADSSAVPTFLVSAVARQLVTVALSGDGGDELFLGYPRYGYHARARLLLSLPRPIRRAAAHLSSRLASRRGRRIADVLRSDEIDRYARFVSWWTPAEIAMLTGDPPPVGSLYADAFARSSHLESASRAGLLDLVSYLPEDILTKVDRASMAVSLEVRAPLLDHRVVQLALALPLRMKHRGGSTKWLLRRLLYKRVPRHLVDRPKMGFGVPLTDWLRGPLREAMDSYCGGDDLEAAGIDPVPVRRVWNEFSQGVPHRPDLLWQVFMLVAWIRRAATQ